MVLTTTLRAMRHIADSIRKLLPEHLDIRVIVQGEASKRDLLNHFQSKHGSGLILVGSATFWEGIDMPGDALQLLVIDKLPFTPPDDPVLEARLNACRAEGGNPFMEYQLPQAALLLKQGAGRLIRTESDRGLLVLCDPRVRQMGYGRQLLAALPPMRKLESAGDYARALEEITRASTRVRPST